MGAVIFSIPFVLFAVIGSIVTDYIVKNEHKNTPTGATNTYKGDY